MGNLADEPRGTDAEKTYNESEDEPLSFHRDASPFSLKTVPTRFALAASFPMHGQDGTKAISGDER
jgi:hypothetical protein